MELRHGVGAGVATCRDSEGERLTRDLDMARTSMRSPFSGSRAGTRVDERLYRHVGRHWADVLSATLILRDAFGRYHNLSDESLNPLDGYLFSKVLQAAPAYLLRRSTNRFADGELPPFIGLLAKAGRGLERAVVQDLGHERRMRKPLVADALLGKVEVGHALLGARAVCPASVEHLRRFLSAALVGGLPDPTPTPGGLVGLVSVESLLRYGAACARLAVCQQLYLGVVARRLRGLHLLPDRQVEAVAGLSEFLVALAPTAPRPLTDDVFAERLVQSSTAMLDHMGLGAVAALFSEEPRGLDTAITRLLPRMRTADPELGQLVARICAQLWLGAGTAAAVFAQLQDQALDALQLPKNASVACDEPLLQFGVAIEVALEMCFGLERTTR